MQVCVRLKEFRKLRVESRRLRQQFIALSRVDVVLKECSEVRIIQMIRRMLATLTGPENLDLKNVFQMRGLIFACSHLEHVFGEVLAGKPVHVLKQFVLLTRLFADSNQQGEFEEFFGQTRGDVDVPA